MTTAVCFTLDGTLLQYDASEATIVERALAREIEDPAPALVETYLDTYRERAENLAEEPHRAGMAAVSAQADSDPDPEALIAALRAAEREAATVPEAARSALETLAADCHLAVVTDAPAEWQRAKVEAFDLPIETVVSAVAAGARKPDPAVFELARERLDAEEFVMVGDDYDRDVEGARAAGFVPIHYEAGEGDQPGFWATLDAIAR